MGASRQRPTASSTRRSAAIPATRRGWRSSPTGARRAPSTRSSSASATAADTALLTCQLETGRTHQIRVHLAAVGHPLVGDSTYGERRSTLGLDRPFLHAAELSFDHPTTGARVTFTSELPADLTGLLDDASRELSVLSQAVVVAPDSGQGAWPRAILATSARV